MEHANHKEGTVDLEAKKSLVKRQTCFSQLLDKDIADLAELCTEVSIPTGKIVVAKGDPVDSIYIVVSGSADVLDSKVKDGQIKWTTVATLGTGDAIGLSETGFYSLSGKRAASVVSLSDMVLLKINVAKLNGLILANSHIADKMGKFKS